MKLEHLLMLNIYIIMNDSYMLQIISFRVGDENINVLYNQKVM